MADEIYGILKITEMDNKVIKVYVKDEKGIIIIDNLDEVNEITEKMNKEQAVNLMTCKQYFRVVDYVTGSFTN